MATWKPDSVIAELRAVREAHAARFNYDVKAIFEDIRAMQEASDQDYASYPPRRVAVETTDGE